MGGWVLYETEILDRKGVNNKQASVFARETHKQTNKHTHPTKQTVTGSHSIGGGGVGGVTKWYNI